MTTKMVEVVAIEAGHDGRVYRRAGELFHVPEDRLKEGSTWFCLPEDKPAPAAAPTNKRPPGAGPAKGSAAGDDGIPGAGPR